MNQLRGAVCGVGYLGTFHAQKYKALSQKLGFNFVGVCDSNLEQAKKVASELGVAYFSDPNDLVGRVDFVSVATSTPTHFELAQLFLKNRIHVNVEKPITLQVEQGEGLIKLAKHNNLILSVGHSERFSSTFASLKNKLKQPLFMDFQRHAPFKIRGSEVSVVHDLMIHDIDLMLALDSSNPSLTASGGGQFVSKSLDWAWAQFSFDSGNQALISVSRIAQQMTRTIKIIERESQYLANFQNAEIETSLPQEQTLVAQLENIGKSDNLLIETENFIEAIQGKCKSLVSGQDGLNALIWVEKIIQNIERQK